MIDNVKNFIKVNLLKLLKNNIPLDEELKSLNNKQWEEIFFIAKRHHIQEYLYYNLKQNKLLNLLDKKLVISLQEAFKQKTFYNMSLLAELKKVSKELKKENIPMIALKGLHLMQNIYPHVALRHSRDLDILIPKNKGEESFKALKNIGYICEKELTKHDFSFKHHHHLHQFIKKDRNLGLERQGHLSEQIHINTNRLWENHQNEKLDLEDLIIHLCVHISYSDIFKNDLRHYLDIYVILEKYESSINWEVLRKRALDDKCFEGIYLVLKIIQKLFNIKLSKIIEEYHTPSKEQQVIILNAIDFLWLYDKSSKDYTFFRMQDVSVTETNSLFKKVLSRVFIPKSTLAYKYSLDEHSNKIYLYYLIRLYDLIKSHTSKIIGMNTNDSKKDFTNKTKFIHNYLTKDE